MILVGCLIAQVIGDIYFINKISYEVLTIRPAHEISIDVLDDRCR